ncbi:hypothetical protein R6Q59_020002 [Mikania micrantha]
MAADTSDESFHFQLDFLLQFISTIVECHAHGKCKLEILDYFNDHTDISQINWAAYVLDIIRNCKNGWKPFSNSPFKGALTILTLLYVASFLCEDMSVDHSIPPIEFWTLDRLHERQTLEIASGGFGRGKFIRLSSVDGETSNINNEEELRKMDLVIQALAATFENIFKEKVDIEKAHDSTELGIINNSVSGVGDSRSWKKDTIDERIFDICLDVNARRQQFIDSETDEEEAPEDEVRLEDKNQGLGGKDDVLEAEPQDKISLEDKNKGSEGRDQVWENANQNLMKELKLRRDKMGLEDQNQRLQGKDQLLEKAKQNLKEELKLKPGTTCGLIEQTKLKPGTTCGLIEQTEKKHAPLKDLNKDVEHKRSSGGLTKAAIIKLKEAAMNLARGKKVGIETPKSTGVSNEKKEVIDVHSSPVPKEKHRGGYQNVQL